MSSVLASRGRSRALYAVLAVTALALVARLVGLGQRVFHWDEGRVGYWILRYHETGEFYYRPIIHGPFLPVVNDWVFTVLPPSDFSARLVVALVGGFLPLSAWLFRERLRDSEVVALSLVLAFNPLLVYYSRFMRNDVLVAAFAFAALGLFVRALDTGRSGYVYAAAASMALGFTAKENAVLYVLCYLGAGTLLLDHFVLRETAAGRRARTVAADLRWGVETRLSARGGSVRGGLLDVARVAAVSLLVFLAVFVFFYAPRPDLWGAFAHPTRLPGVVERGTVGAVVEFYGTWGDGTHQSHDYVPYLGDYVETLVYGAPVVIAFALVGFLADGYGDAPARGLVAFAVYWGAVSVLGYPVATDIMAPWAAVHAVVPFAVPAAVGLAYVYRALTDSAAADDALTTGLAALLVLAAATGAAGANVAYMNSTDEAEKEVLQWAQPGNDMKATLDDVRLVAQHHEGTDVLFYGTVKPNSDEVLFYVQDESSARQPPVGGPAWHSRLPLPWYLERYGAEVTSTPPPPDNPELEDPPPVVVAYGWNQSDLAPQLDGYTANRHRFRLWGEYVVIFVDDEALAAAERAES